VIPAVPIGRPVRICTCWPGPLPNSAWWTGVARARSAAPVGR